MRGLPASFDLRPYRPIKFGLSYPEYLASLGVLGTNNFERAVDGVARRNGIYFDEAQVYEPIQTTGEYTIIDFVKYSSPRTDVFADGIQHRIRDDVKIRDVLIEMDLVYKGHNVVRITDLEFYADPDGVIRSKLLWL